MNDSRETREALALLQEIAGRPLRPNEVDDLRGILEGQLESVQGGDESELDLFGVATELLFPSAVFDVADATLEEIGSLLDSIIDY